MIKAAIIDLDDTLCLTEAVCFEMENRVIKSMGRTPMSREIHINTWGKPLFEAITERSPGIDVEAFREAYHPLIMGYTKSGKLDAISDENYKALDQLIKRGMTILVLTSRTHTELHHLLEPDHLLATRVKAFYYRDNMQYHKPDPRAFMGLLRDNKLHPKQCVYVGDSTSDAIAAKQAGLHFIASLESGLRQRTDFDDLSVDEFIQRFSEVEGAIDKIEGFITAK